MKNEVNRALVAKKKVLVCMLAVAAIVFSSCGGADRAHQLKVLNWADYIDEDVKTNFEQWYYEQTGEKVQLMYETFDINETALKWDTRTTMCSVRRSILLSACSRKI